jgi:hypothetical protein
MKKSSSGAIDKQTLIGQVLRAWVSRPFGQSGLPFLAEDSFLSTQSSVDSDAREMTVHRSGTKVNQISIFSKCVGFNLPSTEPASIVSEPAPNVSEANRDPEEGQFADHLNGRWNDNPLLSADPTGTFSDLLHHRVGFECHRRKGRGLIDGICECLLSNLPRHQAGSKCQRIPTLPIRKLTVSR